MLLNQVQTPRRSLLEHIVRKVFEHCTTQNCYMHCVTKQSQKIIRLHLLSQRREHKLETHYRYPTNQIPQSPIQKFPENSKLKFIRGTAYVGVHTLLPECIQYLNIYLLLPQQCSAWNLACNMLNRPDMLHSTCTYTFACEGT